MRIAVFGATGMAGSAIVAESASRGHHVLALSRHPRPDEARGTRITQMAADVGDPAALDPALSEVDAAVLAVRLAPGDEHRLAALTRGLLDAAERRDAPVLVIGGSAPLRSPSDPGTLLIDDPEHVPEAWRRIARASLEQYRACAAHPYRGWVYLSPPAMLERGEQSGGYRRGTTTLLVDEHGRSRIAAADLALAVLDELEHPGRDRHFTVVQAAATNRSER
ncbi:NAD(P)-dependent oxidoreductase [Gulosibacter sp. 10]|uniref:NAD(P)-dependent oxidoreductase n=1 Tax=Gulosibacter sp. 10 TaxID=1255570 RepID=UPI00097E92E8|nr:NAD(P)H-binding protein [Gulosibacter sp. 10]SJM68685.1 Rrf2-linked NADH-flavin reductase [Gulosibacter sp. 10]